MKKIEKAVLLADIFGADTEKFLPSYLDTLKNSKEYAELKYNLNKNRNYYSSSIFKIKDLYEGISFENVESYEDAVILSGKIFYLLHISNDLNHINPLLYLEKKKRSVTLGDIKMEFDGKDRSLSDIAQDSNYTSRFKVERVKKVFSNWVLDAETLIINPMRVIMFKRRNLPKRKIYNRSKKFLLLMSILLSLVALASFMFKNPVHNYFMLLQEGEGNLKNILYWTAGVSYIVFLVFVFLFDMFFIFDISRRRKFLRRYISARHMLVVNGRDIIEKYNRDKARLYVDLMDSITNRTALEKKASIYCDLAKYYPCLVYLDKINHHRRRIRREEEKGIYSFLMGVTIFALLIVGVIMGLMIGGVIK